MNDSFISDGASSSRAPDSTEKRILENVDKSELQKYRITVRGSNKSGSSSTHINRNIDDPNQICNCVHKAARTPHMPIFDRYIKVNQTFPDSEYSPPNLNYFHRSRSRSHSRSLHRRSRSRQAHRRSKSRSCSHERHDRYRDRHYIRRHDSSSSDSSSEFEECIHTKSGYRVYEDTHRDPRRRKSISPLKPGEYRPSHPDKSLRYKKSRGSDRERSRSRSREQRDTKVRNKGISLSPKRRSKSPSKFDRDRASDRKIRSPKRSEKYERRSRSKTPQYKNKRKRNSRSPRPRSRSPRYQKDKTSDRRMRSPRREERRRSRSPHYKSSSPRRQRQNRSPHRNERNTEIPPDYQYFEGGWVLAPAPPGFHLQRFYPPVPYVRGMGPKNFMANPMMMPRMPGMNPFGPPRPQNYKWFFNNSRKAGVNTSHIQEMKKNVADILNKPATSITETHSSDKTAQEEKKDANKAKSPEREVTTK